jgi:hypothetical protein
MTQENRSGAANARHQQLLELLRSATPTESECQNYLPRLEAYIAAQLDGEEYLTRYADIALHLDRCENCADSYARLYELELALAANALPVPQSIPAPDLSFLSTPKAQSANSLLDLLKDALTTTANTIRLQLTEGILALLQPQQPESLTRSSIDDARYGEVLYELQPEQLPAATLPLRLTAYRDTLHPELCLLEVSVIPPGVHWPNLAGYTVTLQFGDDRVTQTTDAWGVVAFSEVPIARFSEVALEVDLAQ